ncbi:hypothetical protein [Paracoccus sp. MC1862]|uniref:hypothetical protein n=1 Tax=Paracoccus sp. MC1862 TaxID=2760307 RepID=UPI001603EC04|nr:hypothetical protein [Paracoccus sp. MC1862]MBB1498431.1 hypothetical protein [Paracoccus sp. MC1862]QQO46652.1 hypothetical protein JGR78_17090 [Paracoccus sp. MC1862]
MPVDALIDWVRQHAGSAEVHLRGTGEKPPEGVSLALVAIDPAAAFGAGTLRIELIYRLTVQMADAGAGDALLCALAFAALEAPGLPGMDGTGHRPLRLLAPAEAQARHGPAPGPCLHLVLTVERQRDATPALPVTERILRSSQKVPRRAAGRDG